MFNVVIKLILIVNLQCTTNSYLIGHGIIHVPLLSLDVIVVTSMFSLSVGHSDRLVFSYYLLLVITLITKHSIKPAILLLTEQIVGFNNA